MPEEEEEVTITVGMTTAQIALSMMARDILDEDVEGTLHAHLAKFYLTALNALAQKEAWEKGLMIDDVLAAKTRCEERLARVNEEDC